MRPVEESPILPPANSGPHTGYLSALLRELKRLLFDHGRRINRTLPKQQEAGDIEAMEGPLPLKEYTVATRPTASDFPWTIIAVTDGGAGAEFQGSNGTSWVNLG